MSSLITSQMPLLLREEPPFWGIPRPVVQRCWSFSVPPGMKQGKLGAPRGQGRTLAKTQATGRWAAGRRGGVRQGRSAVARGGSETWKWRRPRSTEPRMSLDI